jgi:Chromate transport protein ChrA
MSQSIPQRNLVIFLTFLRLGCIAFGGPAAHLVLFFQYFVKQEKWITEHEYAHLLALAQVLPGPTVASSAWRLDFNSTAIKVLVLRG